MLEVTLVVCIQRYSAGSDSRFMYTVDWGFCKTGIVLEVTLVVCIQLAGTSVRLIVLEVTLVVCTQLIGVSVRLI